MYRWIYGGALLVDGVDLKDLDFEIVSCLSILVGLLRLVKEGLVGDH